jgi:hypothetical protein
LGAAFNDYDVISCLDQFTFDDLIQFAGSGGLVDCFDTSSSIIHSAGLPLHTTLLHGEQNPRNTCGPLDLGVSCLASSSHIVETQNVVTLPNFSSKPENIHTGISFHELHNNTSAKTTSAPQLLSSFEAVLVHQYLTTESLFYPVT